MQNASRFLLGRWLLPILLLLLPAVASAATTKAVQTEASSVRIIASEETGDQDNRKFILLIEPEPGWKVYWKNPGASGFPPTLESEGQPIELLFPTPKAFTAFGLVSFGYGESTAFPFEAKADSKQFAVEYLICEQICIPQEAELSLTDPDLLFAAAEARLQAGWSALPKTIQSSGLDLDFTLKGNELSLILPNDWEAYLGHRLQTGFTDVQQKRNLVVWQLKIQELEAIQSESNVLLHITGNNGQSYEGLLPVRTIESPLSLTAGNQSIGLLLLFAFLGGLLLNFLPCVLPVLGLKMLSYANLAKGNQPVRSLVTKKALVSASAVVSVFAFFALLATLVKLGGGQLTWGFHFQNPFFMLALAFLFYLIVLNLFGLFSLPSLPIAVKVKQQGGLLGDFFLAALATLIATPCTALYLSAVLGFALLGPLYWLWPLFGLIALGLAFPYLLAAIFPLTTAKFFARPWVAPAARWFMRITALPALIWLVFVLTSLTSILFLIALLAAGLALAIFCFWAKQKSWLKSLVALLVGLLLSLLVLSLPKDDLPTGSEGRLGWLPYSAAAIERLEEGERLLVDVTASWCINCSVNALLVYRSKAGEAFFKGQDSLTLLKADWSRPNAEIEAFIRSQGAAGIPLTVVFKKENGQLKSQRLPPLFTLEQMKEAIAF